MKPGLPRSARGGISAEAREKERYEENYEERYEKRTVPTPQTLW
jgi:hypothetical protein